MALIAGRRGPPGCTVPTNDRPVESGRRHRPRAGTLAGMTSVEPGIRPPDTRRPFTRADAPAAGIGPKALRGPKFRRVFRNVYVDVDTPATARLRVEAALRLFDETAFASHRSAARVYDVPIPADPTEHVTVLEARHRRRTAGIRCHLAPSLHHRTPRTHPCPRGGWCAPSEKCGSRTRARCSSSSPRCSAWSISSSSATGWCGRGGPLRRDWWPSVRRRRCRGSWKHAQPRRTSATGSTLRWRPGCGC